jgi:hypothetical protein
VFDVEGVVNARTMPAPMPRLPPVTTTTLLVPSNENVDDDDGIFSVVCVRACRRYVRAFEASSSVAL